MAKGFWRIFYASKIRCSIFVFNELLQMWILHQIFVRCNWKVQTHCVQWTVAELKKSTGEDGGEGGLCDNSKEGENWEFYHLKFYIKIQKSTGRKLGNNLSFKFNLKVEYCVRVRGELKLNDSKEYKSCAIYFVKI